SKVDRSERAGLMAGQYPIGPGLTALDRRWAVGVRPPDSALGLGESAGPPRPWLGPIVAPCATSAYACWPYVMLRGRPLLGIGVAAVLIGAAYFGVHASDEWRKQRVTDEALRSARESAIRAREIVTVQNESVAMMGANAVVNSRLIVALRGRVDRETLADVFAGEAWWEPYRKMLSAISYEGSEVAFSQGAEVESLPLAEMIGQVRSGKAQLSRFIAAAG